MRGLMVAVIGMGILIVGGVSVLVVLLVQRMSSVATPNASPPTNLPTANVPLPSVPPPTVPLDEPIGTRIAGATLGPDRVLLQLSGGGPDRIVVLDLRGRVLGRIALAH